jgi:hypothetical protein
MTRSVLSMAAISGLLGDCPNRAALAKRVHGHLSREIEAPVQLNGHPSRGTSQPHTAFPALGTDSYGNVTWGCQERRCRASGTATTERDAHTIWHEHHVHAHPQVKLTPVEAAALAGNHPPRDARRTLILLLFAALGRADWEACHRHVEALDALDTTDDESTEPGCDLMARIGVWEHVHRRTRIGDTPMALGRWCYDFARTNGRLPTEDETRTHADGRRVRIKA